MSKKSLGVQLEEAKKKITKLEDEVKRLRELREYDNKTISKYSSSIDELGRTNQKLRRAENERSMLIFAISGGRKESNNPLAGYGIF